MAAGLDIVNDLNDCVCSICLETYKNPKDLPCLHTFCETCIHLYILKSVSKEKASCGFRCPICCQVVYLLDRYGPIESWAKKLPTNHLMVAMIDRIEINMSQKQCDACLYNNEKRKSKFWCVFCQEAYCKLCERHHKKFKMTSGHKIVSLNKVVSEQTTNLYVTSIFACAEHPNELIKVFCKDHSKPCCVLCATINHRKCDDVIDIQEASSGVKQSQLTKDILKGFKELRSNLDSDIQTKKQNITTLKLQKEKILNTVTARKEEIVEHISLVENSLKGDLNAMIKDPEIRLEDEKTELSSFRASMDNCIRVLENCLTNGSDSQFLLELNKVMNRKQDVELDVVASIRRMKTASVVFQPDEIILNFENLLSKFGNITLKEDNFVSRVMTQTNIQRPQYLKTGIINVVHSIQLNNDQKKFNEPRACFVGEIVVITDSFNCRIAKYNAGGKIMSDLKLPTNPTDITEMINKLVAVGSYPNTVYIIDINAMKIVNSFQVNVTIGSLRYFNGDFIVTDGYIVSRINSSTGAKTAETKSVGYILYAYSEDDYIYSSDNTNRNIILSTNGVINFEYNSRRLLSPRGVDVDMDGNIYICERILRNIHQISKVGKLINILSLSRLGIGCPEHIRFSANNSCRFLLCCGFSGEILICEIL